MVKFGLLFTVSVPNVFATPTLAVALTRLSNVIIPSEFTVIGVRGVFLLKVILAPLALSLRLPPLKVTPVSVKAKALLEEPKTSYSPSFRFNAPVIPPWVKAPPAEESDPSVSVPGPVLVVPPVPAMITLVFWPLMVRVPPLAMLKMASRAPNCRITRADVVPMELDPPVWTMTPGVVPFPSVRLRKALAPATTFFPLSKTKLLRIPSDDVVDAAVGRALMVSAVQVVPAPVV